jgi:hypothetical protein
MNSGPAEFLEHLRQFGYHPRSDKHSNALAENIVRDLLRHCPRIREKAAAGTLVYDLNFTLHAGTAAWNVDLVLGQSALERSENDAIDGIRKQRPSRVEIAIEIKSVMTEHRKAVKNRKRDLEAHHEHVHNYSDRAIAGGVLVINASPEFRSPLRSETTVHRNVENLVRHCVDELRAVNVRGGRTGYGLEARCAVVVSMDNLGPGSAILFSDPPAPSLGDPLHYDAFIRTLCDRYGERF